MDRFELGLWLLALGAVATGAAVWAGEVWQRHWGRDADLLPPADRACERDCFKEDCQ